MAQQQQGHDRIRVAGSLLLRLLTFLSACLIYVECLCSADESRALLALKSTGETGAQLSSWEEGSDCCQGWEGVTCDAAATHVSALDLAGGIQLRNVIIRKEICELRGLQVFKVSVEFYGSADIPDCLWDMAQLRVLSFSSPMMSEKSSNGDYTGRRAIVPQQGSLPAQVCNLEHLTHLDVGGIAFEVPTVPDCLWHKTQLQHLTLGELQGNQLSSEVCKLEHLTHLDVAPQFFGPGTQIPSCIWRMAGLEYLSLVGFDTASSISSDVCDMKNLTYLDLSMSEVHGEIPSCIWSLTKLEHLSCGAFGGRLSVSISSDICSLKGLSHISMRVDIAQDHIPACLWDLTDLEVLEILPSTTRWPGMSQQREPLHLAPHLRASFSSQLCSLSKLRRLALPYSDITGVLPGCIWSMTNLKYLDLSGLDLSTAEHPTGAFAPSLTHLILKSANVDTEFLDAVGMLAAPALSELRISGNNIVSLPESFRNFTALKTLSASDNLITRVPPWISNSRRLCILELSNNKISDIQTSLDNSSSLFFLDLSSNLLKEVTLSGPNDPSGGPNDPYGSLTLYLSRNKIERVSLRGFNNLVLSLEENSLSDIGTVLDVELSGLSDLNLANNRITSFPTKTLNLPTLSSLDLSSNPLEDISGLCDFHGLKTLRLSNCNIGTLGEGVLPSCLKSFDRLSDINLRNNNISGDLSALMSSSIPNVTQLTSLALSDNNLSGDLSSFSESARPPQFYQLDLSRNQLTGELPSLLLSSTPGAYRGGYSRLDVSGNLLTGRLPEPQGEEWDLNLSGNDFEGPLPSFSNCTFYSLVLSRNSFTGVIPAELRRSSGLYNLDLSYNDFSGEIPAFLGDFTNLWLIDLTSNNFSGSIPETLGDCPKLQLVFLRNNSLSGQIPSSFCNTGSVLQSLTASYNDIEGPIPSSLGRCTRLQSLDLSHNNLEGAVPLTLKNLSVSLLSFTAASNRLSGPFPEWIVGGSFTSLQDLDLSNNNFDGDVPAEYLKPVNLKLSDFTFLEELKQ